MPRSCIPEYSALRELKNFCFTRPRKPSAGVLERGRKRSAVHTPSPPSSSGAQETNTQLQKTPTTKRMANHASLIERDDVVYVDEIEERIFAEARGVTRKNIPCGVFHSTYLSRFGKTDARPELDLNAIKGVGIGSWEQNSFLLRLRKAFPDEILGDLTLSSSFSKTLAGAKKGKEPQSQPDFIFHLGRSASWFGVELLFEHTQSSVQKATDKFLQWMRGAWNVFYHQPFRRHLYGILFLQPYALICYADHGCAGYSEPLDFVNNPQHTHFLADFLANFIAEPDHRGRDPTVTVDSQSGQAFIQHAGMMWTELPDGLLCHRPCVIGRNVRVARVQLTDSPEDDWVMKNTWEEQIQNSAPPPEEEILRILDEANVRGLPQPHESCHSTEGDGDVEVLTSEFPPDCENALAALSEKTMMRIQANYISDRTSKSMPSGMPTGVTSQLVARRIQLQRQDFNECLTVRRRLTRIVMSYCQPLREAMRHAGPRELMRTIRDAMIVYYEVYKRPPQGFLHGDISIENIMVPVEGSKLTGSLTSETRRGTLIDWNLCFAADGTTSGRSFRSGTPAFLAPVLLQDVPIARRTLAHDMESFFAVTLWIASLNYDDEVAFQVKPLVELVTTNYSTPAIAKIKTLWFQVAYEFEQSIIDHFEETYQADDDFVNCIWDLRDILYKRENDSPGAFRRGKKRPRMSEEIDDDLMKERVFKKCMASIDDYLGDEGRQSGSYQLGKIDAGEDPEE